MLKNLDEKVTLKKEKAFSLIELLVSLVVVSVVLAAFTPLLTHKLANSKMALVQGATKITSDCEEIYDTDCKLCEGNRKCIVCSKTCSQGQFQNTDSCSCKPCSEITLGCTICDSKKCSKCQTGNGLADGKCVQCASNQYTDNVSPCQNCPDGFYCENYQKLACPPNHYCKNGAKVACSSAYGPNCTTCNATGCSACNGYYDGNHKCQACPSGHACQNGGIVKCPDNCSSCNFSGACTVCNGGFDAQTNGSCRANLNTQAGCQAIGGIWNPGSGCFGLRANVNGVTSSCSASGIGYVCLLESAEQRHERVDHYCKAGSTIFGGIEYPFLGSVAYHYNNALFSEFANYRSSSIYIYTEARLINNITCTTDSHRLKTFYLNNNIYYIDGFVLNQAFSVNPTSLIDDKSYPSSINECRSYNNAQGINFDTNLSFNNVQYVLCKYR